MTVAADKSFFHKINSGSIEAVVVTEETIRGMDFIWLKTVIMMNVPRSALEYLHICGRVGRLGGPGQALVIVDSDKEIARVKNFYNKLNISGENINMHHST